MSASIEFTFDWIIENIFMAKFKAPYKSPNFYVPWSGTRWYLKIEEISGTATVHLCRILCNDVPARLNLEISLIITGKNDIRSRQTLSVLSTRDEVFHFDEGSQLLSHVNDYVMDDILTLRCKILTKDIPHSAWGHFPSYNISSAKSAVCREVYFVSSEVEKSLMVCYPNLCAARTRITVLSRSVSCTIDNFSGKQLDAQSSLVVPIGGECSLLLNFSFGSSEKTPRILEVDIIRKVPDYEKWTFVKCEINLCCPKQNIPLAIDNFMFEDENSMWNLALIEYGTLTTNPGTYMKGDTLTMRFEFLLSYESGQYDISDSLHLKKYTDRVCQAFQKNLLDLYLRGTLSDVSLRTQNRTFAAHKSIICARSSVFSAMFGAEMQEKTTNTANIPDVDSETLDRLLRFMYSSELEKMQICEAVRLYKAADKYDVASLKDRCALILQSSASPSNFGELLSLVVTYSDTRLKKTVKNLMLLHPEDMFRSPHWISFMESNRIDALEMAYDVFMSKLNFIQ